MYQFVPEASKRNWYTDKVYAFLLKFQRGDIFIIEEKVKPENRQAFISAVKRYIDDQTDMDNQVEFNNDYTKLRKL